MNREQSPKLAIHGHFYQPPRENPWTGELRTEASAAPFHDWNARIAAESYRPNAFARIMDERGWVVRIVNNYENLSFNMGPTLLSWMEKAEPETYARILEGDRIGGGAIAQVFGHIILPLATEADIRLQVKWGLADFKHRFGRDAKGMWLSECAVNDTVLRVMAEEGVAFTILAPYQAAQIRPADTDGEWVGADARWLDTSRPYKWTDKDDASKSVSIVFYDGPLSHAAAFEMSTLDSRRLVDRMVSADGGRNGLVTLSTDGETFGHHHHFGERLIAYALSEEAPNRGLEPANLNWAVEDIAATHEVRVHESAWSCAHGVERWRSDCGCETGAQVGWNQKWRTPLRNALDELRAVAAEVWQRRAPEVFGASIEEALDDYVHLLIGATTREDFIRIHQINNPEAGLALLEMQRDAMSMFTSCGWFFNDLAGLETVQVLRYAARAIDFIEELREPSPKAKFLSQLADARSNIEAEGTGLDIWFRHVETARPATGAPSEPTVGDSAAKQLEAVVTQAVLLAASSHCAGSVEVALGLLSFKDHMGININIDRAQEAIYFALNDENREALKPLADALRVVA